MINGEATCVLTPKPDDTQCSVSNPPNFCFIGSCQSGKCEPTNGLSECSALSTTTTTAATTYNDNVRQMSAVSKTAIPFVGLTLAAFIIAFGL